MEIGYWLSLFHPILIHFPIAFFLGALLMDGAVLLIQDARLAFAGKVLLILGCVLSLFAFVTGNFSEVFAVRGGTPHDPVDRHAIWAMVTTWFFIGLTILRMVWRPERTSRGRKGWFLAMAGACALMGWTAHQGGMLVFNHGAAVWAVHDTHAIDWRDLRDLYQEQTGESIVYSELMHHIFGWLVLGVSLFLISSRIWPDRTRRAWKVGPYLLMAGGCFLMVFSDTDSWPLSSARPIYDKEVLQHKVFAILMMVTAGVSFLRRNKDDKPASSQHFLALALLALTGGGLLFTHVHSVAPYSNRAVGVYLHHLIMGILALGAGASVFWESLSPSRVRWRGFLWPAFLLVESFLLITYNEDIPWFLGDWNPGSMRAMHDADLDLKLDPVKPLAGTACRLHFTPTKGHGAEIPKLEVMHEHPLHLIIVSRDLSFFDHVHPVLQNDGSLILDYTFPHGGSFNLFADYVIKDRTQQSFRIPVQVEGEEPRPQPLVENVYDTVNIDGRDVLLFTKPVRLAPGQPTYLRFLLMEHAKGITDLELFLGCFGHCVIISEDGRYFIHAHPDGHQHSKVTAGLKEVMFENIPNADNRLPMIGEDRRMMFAMGMSTPSMVHSGPDVIFPVQFPASGRYKIWGQFRHRGEVITVPFVVRLQ